MRKQLIKVYVAEQVKAKLEERAGRESLSSFVSGLIDSYFEEYPGLSEADLARMPKLKAGTTVTIKKPPRFVMQGDVEVQFCEHGASAFNCKKWGCRFYEIPNGRR